MTIKKQYINFLAFKRRIIIINFKMMVSCTSVSPFIFFKDRRIFSKYLYRFWLKCY